MTSINGYGDQIRTANRYPSPKLFAFARFTNVNPHDGKDDISSVVFSYRGTERMLTFVAERGDKSLRPDEDVPNMSVQKILGFTGFDESVNKNGEVKRIFKG